MKERCHHGDICSYGKEEQKPIYINNDIFNGTFRRNYEGDYHCTRLQVKAMLCDQTERTMDMEILDKVPMEDLNYDTIHGYRNSHMGIRLKNSVWQYQIQRM